MNKKGILGLDTVKAVVLSLMVLAILAVTIMMLLGTLQTTTEAAEVKSSATYVNESIASVGTPASSVSVVNLLRNPVCTWSYCINASSGTIIPALNYTVSGCNVAYSWSSDVRGFNNSAWNCTYSVSYNKPYINSVVGNETIGMREFFGNVPTFFTLLGVVVLILIIAIVIVAVTRFGGASPESTLQEI